MLSCIIPNLNGEKWLPGLVESLHVALDRIVDEKTEVLLVDDGSTDRSIELFMDLARGASNWRILRNATNLGWSASVNHGLRESGGRLAFVLSNDMTVAPDALEKMRAAFETEHGVGVAQFNSLSLYDHSEQDSGMNFLDRLGYAYSSLAVPGIHDVFFAEGMAFAVTREALSTVGFLDESYFMEYDDMDFSWRAHLWGYRVVFVTDARVFHARGGTVGRTYYNRKLANIQSYTRNHLLTLAKNYSTGSALAYMPWVLVIELGKSAFLLSTGYRPIAWANLRGLVTGLLSIPGISQKKQQIQTARTVPDRQVVRLMKPFKPKELVNFLRRQESGSRHFMGL